MVNFNIFPFNIKNNRRSLNAQEERLLITTTDPKGRGKSDRRWAGLRESPRDRIDQRPRVRPAYRLPPPPEETTR